MTRGRPRDDDILTPREWEVLELLREGLTNEEIAGRLGISFDTAKFHVSEILSKLGVTNRREAKDWTRGKRKGLAAVLPLMAVDPRQSFLRNGGILLLGASLAAFAVFVFAVLWFSSKSEHPSPAAAVQAPAPVMEEQTQQLLQLAAAKIGAPADWLRILAADPVVWSTACLDISQPQSICRRMAVPGYRVRVGYDLGNGLEPVTHEFRTDVRVSAVVWQAENRGAGIIDTISANSITFRGDGIIYDQGLQRGFFELMIRPGSDVLLDAHQLRAGDKVEFGFDGLPSADVGVLVWVIRAGP